MQPMVGIEFAERLSQALDYAGIPSGRGRRKAVSRMFGISVESVRKWLTGESFPDTKRIPEIARRLGVNPNWLISGDGHMIAGRHDPEVDGYVIADTKAIYDVEMRKDVERLIAAIGRGEVTKRQLEAALALLLDDSPPH